MALSADQLSYIRDNSGDDTLDSAGAYEVPDTTIQAIYDDDDTGDEDLNRTVFYVIRRRLGKAARLVSLSGEFGNAQHNQKFENLRKLLALWSSITGIEIVTSGTLTMATISTGIDTPCPDGLPDCLDYWP